ncbi:hypothetical protein AMTR_s00053p00066210 [Amborella trichopoda]|uniref:Uncharacterized protein n=1 Tax=Amborella trichopoda TaxID=13333 RepID=W1PAR2_AMBTC|nr:hypothetical protein AMTR_s00053p00066210 [Amborella trichopoda]
MKGLGPLIEPLRNIGLTRTNLIRRLTVIVASSVSPAKPIVVVNLTKSSTTIKGTDPIEPLRFIVSLEHPVNIPSCKPYFVA